MESPSPRTNDGAAPGLDMASNIFFYLGHSSLTLIALELFLQNSPRFPVGDHCLSVLLKVTVLLMFLLHILSSSVLKLTRMQLWEV